MNHYPSWIQRIPEMIEALESHAADRVDRQRVGELFYLAQNRGPSSAPPLRGGALRKFARDQPRASDGAAA